MDVTTIAFLILLGGTSAEHIIAMPSMEDCKRAAESVSAYQCLTADQFDERARVAANGQSDFQPASGPSDAVTNSNGEPEMRSLEGTPSALKRQVRKALDPQPNPLPPYPNGKARDENSSLGRLYAANRLVLR